MDNVLSQKVINMNDLFDSQYVNLQVLYLMTYNHLPSNHYINQIDGEKALAALKEKFGPVIKSIHQRKWYDRRKRKFHFDKTILLFEAEIAVELDEAYADILHHESQQELLQEIIAAIMPFKSRERRQPLEINLIVQERDGFTLKAMEIKRTPLDIDRFYADDFKAVDQLIQRRLRRKNDKGIVLLHGLPGTGKTSYLRYLVGRIKKRVLFLSPAIAANLVNPEFIELLVNNPNTVLVVEDAENIIMDRRQSHSSAVSNLLNISDGLLADFLNVQLICTFNMALTQVDPALLRKGRLIARYEFGKLPVDKAQRLSDHLGHQEIITRPMTLAELANTGEHFETKPANTAIGFRPVSSLAD
jgi:hypothetical protein